MSKGTRSVVVSTWGRGAGANLGTFRVRVPVDSGVLEIVKRSIERRSGLRLWGLITDGKAVSRNVVTACHYHSTIGVVRPVRDGGGMNPRGEIWVSIPQE